MHFPVSGVDVFPLIPFLVAFAISFVTSMGGVSGAFLLLPFQVSVLGFTSPAVTPTNLVFNIVAIPSGVYRYIKEKRMVWCLAGIIIAGTVPGVFAGAFIRVKVLPDPTHFKLFVACVLFYLSFRLLYSARKKPDDSKPADRRGSDPSTKPEAGVQCLTLTPTRCEYEYEGEVHTFNPLVIFMLCLVTGVVGGVYGIGGGAIVAPFLIAVFRLPVHTTAGATLLGTLCTSIAGVVFYMIIAPMYEKSGMAVAPDWLLGITFGAGGFFGIYCGALFQKRISERIIKAILGFVPLVVAVRYIVGVFV
jgi:uncharacterized membrane protein YfcA